MLGWFKRRLVLEHKKLLLLNYRCANDSELSVRLAFNGLYSESDRLKEILPVAEKMISFGVGENGLSSIDADLAISLNKELMSIFQSSGQSLIEFQNHYQPLGGWKLYFERTGESWNELDDYSAF